MPTAIITVDLSESALIYLDALRVSLLPSSHITDCILTYMFFVYIIVIQFVHRCSYAAVIRLMGAYSITAFRLQVDGFSYGILVIHSVVSRRLYTVQPQILSVQYLTITVILAETR